MKNLTYHLKQAVAHSLLTFTIILLSSMTVHAFERSGVIVPNAPGSQGNSGDLVPADQIVIHPEGPGGPDGPGGGDGYAGPLFECLANNSDCTVFWVIDANPNYAQDAAMRNCFYYPSQACRPLGCHQLPY